MRLLLVLLIACDSGTIELADTASAGDTGAPPPTGDSTEVLPGDTGNTGDSGDTGSGGDSGADPANPWAGGYAGTVGITVGREGVSVCEGSVEIDVAESGGLTGTGDCVNPEAPSPLGLEFQGDVDPANGVATGEASMVFPEGSVVSFDLFGAFSPDAATLEWSGTVESSDGHTVDFLAAAELAPA